MKLKPRKAGGAYELVESADMTQFTYLASLGNSIDVFTVNGERVITLDLKGECPYET